MPGKNSVCVSHSFTHAAVVGGKSGQPLEGLLEHYAMCCFLLFLIREDLMSVNEHLGASYAIQTSIITAHHWCCQFDGICSFYTCCSFQFGFCFALINVQHEDKKTHL